MRTLNRYLAGDFLLTFGMTLLVFTFVMCGAAFVKAIDLMSRGVSGAVIFKVFSYNIPYILSFSIPMSVMTSVLLLFGRMSFDGEITAMKASGMSIWQIISPVILISIGLTFVCVYLNYTAGPNAHFASRRALIELGAEDPVNLLDEGRFTKDFPGLQIYIGKKSREKIKDVVVYELSASGDVEQYIRAQSGNLRMDSAANQLLIDLYDVRIERPDEKDPMDPSRSRTIVAERYPVKLDLKDIFKTDTIRKKTRDMVFSELMNAIRDVRSAFPERVDEKLLLQQRMKMVVDANKRLALAACCFAFALLGIPLGMKSRRKESSRGVGISLMMVFIFYFFVILAESMISFPKLRPDLIVWIPVIAGQLGGFYLIHRTN